MTTNHISPTNPLSRFIGVCDHCVRPIAVEDEAARGDFLRTTCPECTTSVKLERLYGTLVTSIACHSACQGATGPECECSCGGANHGIGFVTGRGVDTLSNIAKFRATRAKKAATVAAKREAKAEAAKAALATWATDNADVVAFLASYTGANEFLSSVAGQLAAKGSLSEKQVAAVRRYSTVEVERSARLAEAKAAEAATAKPAPVGRVVVTGEILSIRSQEGEYGWTTKMLVRCDGFKVWSTVPRDLTYSVGNVDDLKGRQVTFTATLEPSRDDASFAFAKRPTMATLVGAAVL